MWFSKKQQPAHRSTDSLIGHGGSLEGKVQCDTNLRIEGNFSGEILCLGVVTVGEHGVVHSSIQAKEIIIAGKVYGNVTADRRLTMTGGGQLHGNISASSLNIMEGSILNGSVVMHEKPAEAPAGGNSNVGSADKAAKRAAKSQGTLEAG